VEARRACVAAGGVAAHQRVILPKSEENLELERRLDERSQVSVSDLIGLQVDAVAARREYLDAIEAYNTNLIELEQVTGGALNPPD
jgi:outer membrane protein TolC